MPQVILVVGCTGAGKTSHARELADAQGAIRFSIDEWMVPLFGPDRPEPIRFDWMMERINRCEAMIFGLAEEVVARGVPVVLDLGFTTRAHRDRFRALCAASGLSVVVHFVDVPADERWKRVERRNAEQGVTYAMTVDRGMFDFMESIWEPPTDAELAEPGSRRIEG